MSKELFVEEGYNGAKYYDKDEVDALLAEKDEEIARLKHEVWEADERAIDAGATSHEKMQESKSKDEEIRRLKNEIESLKASHYAEMVDAGMRERRLCRLLWLARAERAVTEQTIDEWSRYKEKHPLGSWRVDPFDYWVNAWINVEKLCRKKAEQYK